MGVPHHLHFTGFFNQLSWIRGPYNHFLYPSLSFPSPQLNSCFDQIKQGVKVFHTTVLLPDLWKWQLDGVEFTSNNSTNGQTSTLSPWCIDFGSCYVPQCLLFCGIRTTQGDLRGIWGAVGWCGWKAAYRDWHKKFDRVLSFNVHEVIYLYALFFIFFFPSWFIFLYFALFEWTDKSFLNLCKYASRLKTGSFWPWFAVSISFSGPFLRIPGKVI